MRWSPPHSRIAAALVPFLVVVAACTDRAVTPLEPAALARVAPARNVSPTAWSAAGPGTVTLNNSGSTSNPSMSYELYGTAVWSTKTWSFSTTAATTGAITENYDYSGFHAFYNVTAFVHPFIVHNAVKSYLPGSNYGPVNCCSSPSNGFDYTGSVTFNVVAGDTYGFEFGGANFDRDARLLGDFTIIYPPKPLDSSPPAVQAVVAGTLGANGWYTSDVNVSWTVTDDQSPVTSTSGCDAVTVSTDAAGLTYTCNASSEGGSASASVTINRDATVPAIAFSGNAGTYTVDQQVSIGCSASDAMSGLAASNCPGATGAAWTFGAGTQTLSASAQDNAGNNAAASTQFTVQVTSGGLCALVNQWVSQKGVANSMCQQLRNSAYGAFRNHVGAQSGKTVTAANAATLIALSQSL